MARIIADSMNVYQPYFNDDRTFAAGKAQRVLAERNIACPTLDYRLFAKCIQYAIQVQWGKRLFEGHQRRPESALA